MNGRATLRSRQLTSLGVSIACACGLLVASASASDYDVEHPEKFNPTEAHNFKKVAKILRAADPVLTLILSIDGVVTNADIMGAKVGKVPSSVDVLPGRRHVCAGSLHAKDGPFAPFSKACFSFTAEAGNMYRLVVTYSPTVPKGDEPPFTVEWHLQDRRTLKDADMSDLTVTWESRRDWPRYE